MPAIGQLVWQWQRTMLLVGQSWNHWLISMHDWPHRSGRIHCPRHHCTSPDRPGHSPDSKRKGVGVWGANTQTLLGANSLNVNWKHRSLPQMTVPHLRNCEMFLIALSSFINYNIKKKYVPQQCFRAKRRMPGWLRVWKQSDVHASARLINCSVAALSFSLCPRQVLSADTCRARPYEKVRVQGFTREQLLMAFRWTEASSSLWPPERNVTPAHTENK
jgi:hypothetical protein